MPPSSTPTPAGMGSVPRKQSSPFQCQRCRVALIPHKSLVDLKPAQFNLLTSSLQLAVDAKEKQQLQNATSGYTVYGVGAPGSDPTTPHVPWGLSTLPEEAQSMLFGRGGAVGSFIALPDTRFLQAEQQKSMAAREAKKNTAASLDNLGQKIPSKSKQVSPLETPPGTSSSSSSNTGDSMKPNSSGTTGTSTTGSVSANISQLESRLEIISSKSEIDYPVCTECAELLKESLKTKYEEECRERDAYISFISTLKGEINPTESEIKELTDKIKQMELENEEALKELELAEKEQEELDKELADLKLQYKELELQEEQFYKDRNSFILDVAEVEAEKDRVESILNFELATLTRLQKVNVYNDVFYIGSDGCFGTINGLRLGRLKDRMVEWSEINAAWGQTLLLLYTVINRLNFKIEGYRLLPQGSVSHIEKFDRDPKSGEYTKSVFLELYSSGDYTFERFLNHKRLDAAMVAFLAVMKQVGDHVEANCSDFKLPYHIFVDKIGDHSIRLSINASNEKWTAACKYVLINSKWLLAYASLGIFDSANSSQS